MKKSVKILLILLAALVLGVMVIVANVSRNRSQVRGVTIHIRYGRMPHLVEEQAVADTLLKHIPTLTRQRVRDVNRQEVAEAARRVSTLRDVTASVSVSGNVVVKARQRRPIARLLYADKTYYFDDQSVVFPTSPVGNCNVLVVGGDFSQPLRPDSLNAQVMDLVTVAKFLDDHANYGLLIDQLYAEQDGDIMMVPKLGDHVVELGNTEHLDQKFSNLAAFYRKGMPRAGWHTYSKISLKFDGQVVCTKKNIK